MTYSFNLVDQPWIPCIGPDGSASLYSIREALRRAAQLRGIAGVSPPETAALHRLLLAILHSALRGPESAAAWNALWLARSFDQTWLHDYLDEWKPRFDLFNLDRPFYQTRETRLKTKSVINLVMDMASGNNAVLFDHHTEDRGAQLSPAQAARVLLTAQTFGLAGLCDPQQKLNFTDGPWARGVIFLLEGENLFQSLALNLLRYDVENNRPIAAESDDRPAWESDDPYKPIRDWPLGYLDYLTWPNRRILLIPEGPIETPVVGSITVAPGLRLNATVLDPMKNYRKDEKFGYLALRFSEERALWRDSAALFQVDADQGGRSPLNFEAASHRFPDEPQRRLRCMALGMASDQAKIEFFRHEHIPLPLAYLETNELVEKLANALQLAEEAGFSVRSATNWLALLVVSPPSDGMKWKEVNRISRDQASQLSSHWAIERFFWGELEWPFTHLLDDLPENYEGALAAWKQSLQQAAWRALDQAANLAGESPHALKAAVRARSHLGAGLHRLFNPNETKEVYA